MGAEREKWIIDVWESLNLSIWNRIVEVGRVGLI